jgi:predicted RNase H-like nuclease (RuvC/YqgF family)
MGEKEEKLIKKIIKLQKEQNSLKLDEQIENYKKEIKEADKIIEKTKIEIGKLSSQLNQLKNKNENNNTDNKENIENKRNELEKKLRENEMKKNQLNYLEKSNENFKNEEYILELIKYWNPQTMFKYIELYDKKSE